MANPIKKFFGINENFREKSIFPLENFRNQIKNTKLTQFSDTKQKVIKLIFSGKSTSSYIKIIAFTNNIPNIITNQTKKNLEKIFFINKYIHIKILILFLNLKIKKINLNFF